MSRQDTTRAVVVARDDRDPSTAEIERLTDAAGHTVVARVTQRRVEDRRYGIGSGKATELADLTAEVDADRVVYDGRLSPGQYASLCERLPPGVEVTDRYRLVLEVFAAGATDERARLQVERARLAHELPRLRQTADESLLNRATEKGSPVLDREHRIDRIDRKLDDLAEAATRRRERRREEGFALVALAGYTNAGKTTLLRRLADDLAVGRAGHDDLAEAASVADRLFETLDTTTRRATVGGRPTLVTDTVGLLEGLPHDLVEAFGDTLGAAREADVTLLVVDGTDDPATIERKCRTARDAVGDARLIPVLNKIDAVDRVAERRSTVRDALDGDPVPVSAREGTGIDELRDGITAALPTAATTVTLPNDGRTHRLLSWAHDHGRVADRRYEGDTVRVRFEARPRVVDRFEARVADRPGIAEG